MRQGRYQPIRKIDWLMLDGSCLWSLLRYERFINRAVVKMLSYQRLVTSAHGKHASSTTIIIGSTN